MNLEQLPVAAFLKEMKSIVRAGRFSLIEREKNLNALTSLGLTKKNVIQALLELSVTDYCSGPADDETDDRPGKIWVFGIEVFGSEFYVKLKIFEVGNKKYVKCLSFHPPERPLRRPWS